MNWYDWVVLGMGLGLLPVCLWMQRNMITKRRP